MSFEEVVARINNASSISSSSTSSVSRFLSPGESAIIATTFFIMIVASTPLNLYVSRALHQMPPAMKRSLIDYVVMYSSTVAVGYAIVMLPPKIAHLLFFAMQDNPRDVLVRSSADAFNGTEAFGDRVVNPISGDMSSWSNTSDFDEDLSTTSPSTAGISEDLLNNSSLASESRGPIRVEYVRDPLGGKELTGLLHGLCWTTHIGDSFFFAVMSNFLLVTPIIRFLYVFFPVVMLSISVRVASRRLFAVIILAALVYALAATFNPDRSVVLCIDRIHNRESQNKSGFNSRHVFGIVGATALNVGINVFAYSSIWIYLGCCRHKPGRPKILGNSRESFHVVPLVVNLAHVFFYVVTSSIAIAFVFFLRRPHVVSIYLSQVLVLVFFLLLSPCAILFGSKKIQRRFQRDVSSFFSFIMPWGSSWTMGRQNTVSVALVEVPVKRRLSV